MSIITDSENYEENYRLDIKLGTDKAFLYFETNYELKDYLNNYVIVGTSYKVSYWDDVQWILESKGEVK